MTYIRTYYISSRDFLRKHGLSCNGKVTVSFMQHTSPTILWIQKTTLPYKTLPGELMLNVSGPIESYKIKINKTFNIKRLYHVYIHINDI